MAITIENRGTRAVVIQLDASALKVRQKVQTMERSKETGKTRVISKNCVFGGSLTIGPRSKVSKLPNMQPIPDAVAQLEQVRTNRKLRITKITAEEWAKENRRVRHPEDAPGGARKSRKTARAIEPTTPPAND